MSEDYSQADFGKLMTVLAVASSFSVWANAEHYTGTIWPGISGWTEVAETAS